MPIRRVNSTGRKRIFRDDVRITLQTDPDGVIVFDADLSLNDYELPQDATVYVEAYRQTTFMRFEFGTVGLPRPPVSVSRRLTEFASRERLLFRVKVSSVGNRPGVLLAEADQVPVADDEEQPENRVALLPPAPGDLGQEVWRVDISEAQGPQLLVNRATGDWKALASSWTFRALVFPAAMRQVLWHIVAIRNTRHTDDASDWGCRWLKFASSIPGAGPIPSADDGGQIDFLEWSGWIDSAIDAFTRRHAVYDRYSTTLPAENHP
jgi:hypothetical protein